MVRTSSLFALALVFVPAVAHAHIQLVSPAARYTDLKDGQCGRGDGDARTGRVTAYPPGATITVRWRETVSHPGHHRISFDPDGARFTDPSSFTDTAPRAYVLVDNIADKTGLQEYSQTVTLPNMTTTNGTLQVIQVMSDKPPYGDGNDLYYQCADITLDPNAPAEGMFVDTSSSTSSGSSSGSSSSGASSSSSGSAIPSSSGSQADGGCAAASSGGEAFGAGLAAFGALVFRARRRRSARD